MELFERLVRYETELWNVVSAQVIRDGGIGLGTLLALRIIERHPDRARVQELSNELAITVSAASKFTDRLERDGLIARGPNPDDRRSSLLTLTDAGRAAVRAGEASAQAVLKGALHGDDADGLAALLDGLEQKLAGARA